MWITLTDWVLVVPQWPSAVIPASEKPAYIHIKKGCRRFAELFIRVTRAKHNEKDALFGHIHLFC